MDLQLLTDYEKTRLADRQPLPDSYRGLSDDEMAVRIGAAKAALGDRLVILGHHYQRDEVIRFADYTGDSLKLAQAAAARSGADFIVFCGVHFMAESADVLCAPHQQVLLPDLAAGCSMADMAAIDQLEVCWQELRTLGAGERDSRHVHQLRGRDQRLRRRARRHRLHVEQRGKGDDVGVAARRQTADAAGPAPRPQHGVQDGRRGSIEMVIWDPDLPFGGVSRQQLQRAKLILWKGHCSVHTRFSVRQIAQFRQQHPTGKVIVHPECTFDVMEAADACGSTEFIIKTVKNSPEGSIWAVGTEIHLVNRLAREVAPARTVVTLDALGCLCSTMFRVSPNHLLWILESLVDGEVHNRITVPEPAKKWAKVALDRMLANA